MADNQQLTDSINGLVEMLQQQMLQRSVNPWTSAGAANASMYHNQMANHFMASMATNDAFTQRLSDMGSRAVSGANYDEFRRTKGAFFDRQVGNLLNSNMALAVHGQGSAYDAAMGLNNIFTAGGARIGGINGFGAGISSMAATDAAYKAMFGAGGKLVDASGMVNKNMTAGADKTKIGQMWMNQAGLFKDMSADVMSTNNKGGFTAEFSEAQADKLAKRTQDMARMYQALGDVFSDKSIKELSDIADKIGGQGRLDVGKFTKIRKWTDRLRGEAASFGVDERAYMESTMAVQGNMQGSIGSTAASTAAQAIVQLANMQKQAAIGRGGDAYTISAGEAATKTQQSVDKANMVGGTANIRAVGASLMGTNPEKAKKLLEIADKAHGDESAAAAMMKEAGLYDFYVQAEGGRGSAYWNKRSDQKLVAENARKDVDDARINTGKSRAQQVRVQLAKQEASESDRSAAEDIFSISEKFGDKDVVNMIESLKSGGDAEKIRKEISKATGMDISKEDMDKVVGTSKKISSGTLDSIRSTFGANGGITGSEQMKQEKIKAVKAMMERHLEDVGPQTNFLEDLARNFMNPDGTITDEHANNAVTSALLNGNQGELGGVLNDGNSKKLSDGVAGLKELRDMNGMDAVFKIAGVDIDAISKISDPDAQKKAVSDAYALLHSTAGDTMTGGSRVRIGHGSQRQADGSIKEGMVAYTEDAVNDTKAAIEQIGLSQGLEVVAAESGKDDDSTEARKARAEAKKEEFARKFKAAKTKEERAKLTETSGKEIMAGLERFTVEGHGSEEGAQIMYNSLNAAQKAEFMKRDKNQLDALKKERATAGGKERDALDKKIKEHTQRVASLSGQGRFLGILEVAASGGVSMRLERKGGENKNEPGM